MHRPVQKLIAFEIAERERSDEQEANNENETVVIQSKLNQTTAEAKAAIDGQNTRRLRDLYHSETLAGEILWWEKILETMTLYMYSHF